MKIGDYVKYDNDLWEITYIDDVSEKDDYYLLICRTADELPLWVKADNNIIKTNLSQLTFEL